MKMLGFIRETISHTGKAPTYSEMKKYMKVTSNQTVSDLLSALERKSYIKIHKGERQGIEISQKALIKRELEKINNINTNNTSTIFFNNNHLDGSR